jgi:spore coat protein U-like protein
MKAIFFSIFIFLHSFASYAACTAGLVTTSSGGIAFGNYSANSASDKTMNGTVTANCTVGGSLPSFTIALSTGGSATFEPRKMNFLVVNTLNYNIYTTNSYATIWGDGTNSTVTQSYGGGGGSTNFTAYGKIPTGQYVLPGIYGDSITITVTY